jgi:hypothetical protein
MRDALANNSARASSRAMLVMVFGSLRARAVLAMVAAFLATAAAASAQEAQEAASSFAALVGRIRVGQVIWVTDTTGRETRGRLERLSTDELVLKDPSVHAFAAPDVRGVRARDRDSLKNGVLIGLGVHLDIAERFE